MCLCYKFGHKREPALHLFLYLVLNTTFQGGERERSLHSCKCLEIFLDMISNFFLIQMRLLKNELTCFVPSRAQNNTGVIKSQSSHCFKKLVLPPVSSPGFVLTFWSQLSCVNVFKLELCSIKQQINCSCAPTVCFLHLQHWSDSVMYHSPSH